MIINIDFLEYHITVLEYDILLIYSYLLLLLILLKFFFVFYF